MHTLLESNLRAQLLDRRARLRMLVEDPALRRADDLVGLLETVDAALARMDAGSYGQCELCHESVDDDWLAAKPLIQYCLCELSPRQQAALEHDLALARRIQLGLLPAQDFTAGGWETHFRYIPAGPVSGDYCDLVAPRDGHAPSGTAPTAALYALLGDVSGKGVAAALLMARLSALFRGLIELNLPLPELFARASRLFAEGAPSTHFATLVCARAEASGAVELCNAGHCEPLVVRRGEVRPVESSGAPLGLADHGPYETHRVRLAPGD
ncbi:MAG: PP2C family protein-serine/threonine phosphatase, partial [Planctomycetota bacterium]